MFKDRIRTAAEQPTARVLDRPVTAFFAARPLAGKRSSIKHSAVGRICSSNAGRSRPKSSPPPSLTFFHRYGKHRRAAIGRYSVLVDEAVPQHGPLDAVVSTMATVTGAHSRPDPATGRAHFFGGTWSA